MDQRKTRNFKVVIFETSKTQHNNFEQKKETRKSWARRTKPLHWHIFALKKKRSQPRVLARFKAAAPFLPHHLTSPFQRYSRFHTPNELSSYDDANQYLINNFTKSFVILFRVKPGFHLHAIAPNLFSLGTFQWALLGVGQIPWWKYVLGLSTPRTSRKELKSRLAKMQLALEASRREIKLFEARVSDFPLPQSPCSMIDRKTPHRRCLWPCSQPWPLSSIAYRR